MNEAEIGYHRAVSGTEPRYISSVLSTISAWMLALVFVVWMISGPPFDVGVSPIAQAAARALLGVLVIPMLRFNPAAIGIAWMLVVAVAAHGAGRWAATGNPAPYHVWEVVVPAAYAVLLPVLFWRVQTRTISLSSLAADTRPSSQSIPLMDGGKVGRPLASKVADLLEAGESIVCGAQTDMGTGLCYVEGRFVFDDVIRGRLACLREGAPRFDRARAIFSERAGFVSWLADQDDESLSGNHPTVQPAATGEEGRRITRDHLKRVTQNLPVV